MKIQFIRNATVRLEYAGLIILIDPMLGPRHSFDSFAGVEDNPTAELTISPAEVIQNLDLMLVSHLHEDHLDQKAQQLIDRSLPILCQPGDLDRLAGHGFNNVVALEEQTRWQNVTISRTDGRHGTGKWAERLNPVSGFVFQFPGEPVLYWVGDSIWCPEVQNAINYYQPDVIVTHSGGAELEDSGPIIMDASQTIKACQYFPSATVIATHLEALDHCLTTRSELRSAAALARISSDKFIIPDDGDLIEIE